MNKCFFVTGTDTNIGKTLSCCAILKSASYIGYKVSGYKPISTGSKLINNDVLSLIANSNVKIDYYKVNPLNFITSTSPDIACKEENRTISFDVLSSGLRYIKSLVNFIIIEGAGGWFTPLNDILTYADWVLSENLPIILIVGIKLGCINHALLTVNAIYNAKLNLVGWIANYPELITNLHSEYLCSLKKRLNIPLLGIIPWLRDPYTSNLSKYIDINLLKKY